jgi:Cell division protein CrgA
MDLSAPRGGRRVWLTSHPVATSTKGPGGASRKGKSATGRTTSSRAKIGRYKTPEESGRYTAPIPKNVRHSPPWFGALILILLIGGVVVITVNYLASLPGLAHGSPWGLVIGLAMIFAGFLLATRYR